MSAPPHTGGDDECLVLPFDATDYKASDASLAAALKWKGHVDVLILNLGRSQHALAQVSCA